MAKRIFGWVARLFRSNDPKDAVRPFRVKYHVPLPRMVTVQWSVLQYNRNRMIVQRRLSGHPTSQLMSIGYSVYLEVFYTKFWFCGRPSYA